MYRLMIVDDEAHTRQQIRNALNWAAMGIEIIGEAENGLKGLSMASENPPDIVICDVRMPRMDGISFSTELLYQYPSAQIIFLSGYSDKMYLKNAIRLEAVDYIFKPFELSDLAQAVEKAIDRLKRTPGQTDSRPDSDLALKLLFHSSSADSAHELDKLLENPAVPVNFSQPYIAILVQLTPGISFSRYKTGNTQGADSLAIQELVSRYYQAFDRETAALFQEKYLISKGGNSYIIFANLPQSDLPFEEQPGQITRLLHIVQEVSASIGISSTHLGKSSINTAFQEARQAVLSGFLRGFQKLYTNFSAKPFTSEHEARDSYFSSLEGLKITEASCSLDNYITYMAGCSPQYISAMREDLLQIALHLNDKLKSPPFALISEFVHSAASLQDIRDYIQYLLTEYQTEINSMNTHGRIVSETERYILNHLGDPLTVKQIADHVYVSSTYLCFLYKKQTGKTLNQFILDMRMEKAKSLLMDTNLKIGDIAASLGYANQNYFTRNFVHYYGTTPSNYRNHQH